MVYTVQRKTVLLVFEDPELAGAEVRCRSVSLGTFLEVARLEASGVTELDAMFRRFGAEVLQEWNLQDEEGQPIPATTEGLLSLDLTLALAIVRAWVTNVASPSVPLGAPSSNGVPPEVAELPLALMASPGS